MKLHEEFKLYETMWESASRVVSKETGKLCESASKVVSKKSDELWTVSFKNDPKHPIFTGDKEKANAFYNHQKNTPSAKAHGGLVIKQGGEYYTVANESASKVVRKKSDELWTVSFKSDPKHPIFTGDKASVDAFYDQQKDTPSAKTRGGLVIKRGGEYYTVANESASSKKVTKSAKLTEALAEKEYSIVYRLKDWAVSQPDDEAFFDAKTATDAIKFFMEYMLDPDNLDDDIDPADRITEADIIIISVAPTVA